MAYEPLSIKLRELDDSLGKLHSRIHLSQSAGHEKLCREIRRLELECSKEEMALQEKLSRSKTGLTAVLAKSCRQIEEIITQSETRMRVIAGAYPDPESTVEEQLLLAEYALDFAHRAADRALLISMEAIDAQLTCQEKGGTP